MGALAILALGNILSSPASDVAVVGEDGPFRPPQWSTSTPPFTMTATDPVTGQQTAYVFDAIIRLAHRQQSVITLNPVQTGAAISDNAYIVPPKLVIEIGMSDAMQSYTVGQWADAPSRSVSAYQTLVGIQAELSPVQIVTRLRSYSNMMIADIQADDDSTTAHALKATISFEQILTAQAQIVSSSVSYPTSEIPQTTNQTPVGQVQTIPVPASIQSQNNIENVPED